MGCLTPQEMVDELNKAIIGQDDAKLAVASAIRNRWRRRQLNAKELMAEVRPHNILMIGPTGVGKTEIARRISKITNAPFVKVEATKFTEVGYVGRDVDSIIRDLVDVAISKTREEMRAKVIKRAEISAKKKIIKAVAGDGITGAARMAIVEQYNNGELDEIEIDISVSDTPKSQNPMQMMDIPGGQVGMLNMGDMFGKMLGMGKKTKTIKIKVKDALIELIRDESDNLIDEEEVVRCGIELAENEGIVFIDEIDKIASPKDYSGVGGHGGGGGGRGEVSREGVQRDLLPMMDGCNVTTKYGLIKTDHVLFITSGAFHNAKPSDLLPELQGRLPTKVYLRALGKEEMVRIMTEPEHNLIKQYCAMLAIDGIHLDFSDSAINEIATLATEMNEKVENIGARRLHTLLEKILAKISFCANCDGLRIKIDDKYVIEQMQNVWIGKKRSKDDDTNWSGDDGIFSVN